MTPVVTVIEPVGRRLRAMSAPARVLVGMIAAYVAVFGTLTWQQQSNFGTFGFDMGIYDQGIWLVSRGRTPFVTVRGLNYFGHHVNLITLLLVPASQAAIELVNTVVSRLLPPRELPSMDFSDGIPDDYQSMVVIPTLVYSEQNVAKLLEDLEIRYLANRSPNLFFALLTDFTDADLQQTANDSVVDLCADGIRRLNAR